MTTVLTENEAIRRCDQPHQPVIRRRQLERETWQGATALRQEAHEPHHVRLRGLGSERMRVLEATDFPTVAEHNLRGDGKCPRQRCPEFSARSGLPHDERAGRTDIHDLKPAEFVRQVAGSERSVAADIGAAEEDN